MCTLCKCAGVGGGGGEEARSESILNLNDQGLTQ